MQATEGEGAPLLAPGAAEVLQAATRVLAGGRRLVASADEWRRQELARVMARLEPAEQAAVTAALGLLVS